MIQVLMQLSMAAPGIILLAFSAAVGGWNPTVFFAVALYGVYMLGRIQAAESLLREAREAQEREEHDEP